MAISGLSGASLLGFNQGQAQAQANRMNQLSQFGVAGNTFITTADTIWIATSATSANTAVVAKPGLVKKWTLRQELQADVDVWLPEL